MYIYKFVITFFSGRTLTEWLTCEEGESVASLKRRADRVVDEHERDESVKSVHMSRRLVPGI